MNQHRITITNEFHGFAIWYQELHLILMCSVDVVAVDTDGLYIFPDHKLLHLDLKCIGKYIRYIKDKVRGWNCEFKMRAKRLKMCCYCSDWNGNKCSILAWWYALCIELLWQRASKSNDVISFALYPTNNGHYDYVNVNNFICLIFLQIFHTLLAVFHHQECQIIITMKVLSIV